MRGLYEVAWKAHGTAEVLAASEEEAFSLALEAAWLLGVGRIDDVNLTLLDAEVVE